MPVNFKNIKTTGNRPYNAEMISRLNDSLQSVPTRQRSYILGTIIEESGGNPLAVSKRGKYQGLLQWGTDRYRIQSKNKEAEFINQLQKLREINDTSDRINWTHGGKQSGYHSFREAYNDYNNSDIPYDQGYRAFSYGYVRPKGKEESIENRLKVVHQVYDRLSFKNPNSYKDIDILHYPWQQPEPFEPKKIYAEGGEIEKPKMWDALSLKDKSDIMASAVKNGLTTLQEIRQKWNEFAEGGNMNVQDPSEEDIPATYPYKVKGLDIDADNEEPLQKLVKNPDGSYSFHTIDSVNDVTTSMESSDILLPEVVKTANYPYEQRVIDIMNNSSPEFLERLRNNDKRSIKNSDGTYSTHVLGSADNIVFPQIQDVNGVLVDYRSMPWESAMRYAIKNNDYIEFPTEGDARYFAEHYKKYFPAFFENIKASGGNLFKGGGYIPSASIKKDISTWEGDSMQTNRSFEAETKDFNRVVPENIRKNLSQEQLDSLFSYGYNVGMGNLKKRVIPTLTDYVQGKSSAEDVARNMWAAGDKKLRGLQRRRNWERNMFINHATTVSPHPVSVGARQPVPLFNPLFTSIPSSSSVPVSTVETPVIQSNSLPVERENNVGEWMLYRLLTPSEEEAKPLEENQTISIPFVINSSATSSPSFGEGGHLYEDGSTLNDYADYFNPEIHTLPEAVVTASRPDEYSWLRPLTLSNDVTIVENGRPYNDHLNERSLSGSRAHAAWEKSHPTLSFVGNALAGAPLAVAATPFAIGAGDVVAGTAIGQALGAGLKNALPYIDAGMTSWGGAEAAKDIANNQTNVFTALELFPATRVVKPLTKNAKQIGNEIWHSTWAQYPRYYLGKMYYGKNTELPTLYRKLRNIPELNKSKIQISPVYNRFEYLDGTESPLITNMTTDVPVRSHASNWDDADVISFSGKTLLGKHVISTRPSDTFTYGNIISVKPDKVTYISGRPEALKLAEERGMNTVTNPQAQNYISNHVLNDKNYSGYAHELQRLSRSIAKAPTEKDYKFMDWVFQPQFKSEVIPYRDLGNLKLDELDNLPTSLQNAIFNADSRIYLKDPTEWVNVIYDPETTAEEEFRMPLGIKLKKE